MICVTWLEDGRNAAETCCHEPLICSTLWDLLSLCMTWIYIYIYTHTYNVTQRDDFGKVKYQEVSKLRETWQSDFIRQLNITVDIIVETSVCAIIICWATERIFLASLWFGIDGILLCFYKFILKILFFKKWH
jgi:hypothetical protein